MTVIGHQSTVNSHQVNVLVLCVTAYYRSDNFTLADFDRTFAINVRAVFVAMQAAVKHMKEGERIINIGSTNAERMPFIGGVYAMSKSALQGLARELWVISEIVKATLVNNDRLKYPAKA
ncbi:SDR family NAD(P)-dependent oxidoreductase [Nostoc favosum]|uniref:SDR family NAD(P)-dependent oxidoreductase n=1 Tax=Nostoc favosum CHAB5714 TaxID=2780399 RepID=A0ABS8ICR4_9NOSO|nr:SDR family NAD(P)-dependent oxidoreductase [Nostoc favosum]MCC5601543.1 SDR family NAD(P)-dependent oxidoreductase [Nostoc favosum CHAB5714]